MNNKGLLNFSGHFFNFDKESIDTVGTDYLLKLKGGLKGNPKNVINWKEIFIKIGELFHYLESR